jgi:hypothetical protein
MWFILISCSLANDAANESCYWESNESELLWNKAIVDINRVTILAFSSSEQKTRMQQPSVKYAVEPEDGGDMILRKISWLLTDYMPLYPRKWTFPRLFNHRVGPYKM